MSNGDMHHRLPAALAKLLGKGESTLAHHAIFHRFCAYAGPVKAGLACDYIGTLVSSQIDDWGPPQHDYEIVAQPPSFDEEYFEWLDLLEAVEASDESFTFIELGAGYGRWSVRALKAAEQRKIRQARAILVEAEPRHVELVRAHMANNGISSNQFDLVEAAVDATPGKAAFLVSAPGNEPGSYQGGRWFGQSLASAANVQPPTTPSKRQPSYYGKPVL